jgi:hypothetical protein
MKKFCVSSLVVALAAYTAQAHNVQVNVDAGPGPFAPGQVVTVNVSLQAETTPVTGLQHSQVDLRVMHGDPGTVSFAGGLPGPNITAAFPSAFPCPPSSCTDPATLYVWFANPPAGGSVSMNLDSTPLPFISFNVTLPADLSAANPTIIELVDPDVADFAAAGAYFDDGTGQIGGLHENGDDPVQDPANVHNVVGGTLVIIPEPAGLALVVMGAVAALRRRRTA